MFIGIIGFVLFAVFILKGLISIVRKKNWKRDFKIAAGSFVLFFSMLIVDSLVNPPEQVDQKAKEEKTEKAEQAAKKSESDDKQKDEEKKDQESGSEEKSKEEVFTEESKEDEAKKETSKQAEKKTAPNDKVAPSAFKGVQAQVTRVVDGDTIKVSMNGKTEDVRLLLLDTPETVHPSEPVQPYGPEASAFAKETLSGKTVGIQVGSEERDNYGRLLAYVWVGDTTYQEMVLEKGLGRTAYLYNDLTMLDKFHQAQDKAKSKRIGVWSIPGYAHVDHNHGYHYQKEESEPEPKQETSSNLKYDPNGPDRDCGDFDTQQQAQDFMEASGPGDPHRLDGNDKDGLACESL